MIDRATESNPLHERARALAWQIKRRLEPADTWVRTLVRERPLVALAGAAGIGYLLGRLIRR
jgi:ElaB/YqjD/DUF883 family membrane-anchored ribosome-binding protein